MASTAVRQTGVKQVDKNDGRRVVSDCLEALARQGARQTLTTALQEEVVSRA